MGTLCPYCHIEVSESSIEAEDGCCPECGSVITAASSIFEDDHEDFDNELRLKLRPCSNYVKVPLAYLKDRESITFL